MSAFQKYNDAIRSEYGIPEFEEGSPFFKLALDVEVEQAQLLATVALIAGIILEFNQTLIDNLEEFSDGYRRGSGRRGAESMSAESELRTAAWHLPEGFDTMKNVAFAAADELSMATRQIIRDTELMRQDGRERNELSVTVAQQAARIAALEQAVNEARNKFEEIAEAWGAGSATAWLTAHPAPVCPECDSEILPSQYCMMGHWCGESDIPVIDEETA